MRISTCYSRGIKRATAEGKMVWLLWLVNVLFAGFVYIFFSGFLNDLLSRRAAAQNFLKTFDMNTFFEVITYHGEAIGTFISLATCLLVGYVFASVFLDGGILYTLAQTRSAGEKRRLASLFFKGAGKFFGRFFRLLVFSLILWVGVIFVMFMIHAILNPFTEGGTNEALLFYLVLVRVAIALFLVFLVKMIVDYARIQIVVEDSKKVFPALFRAMGFVFRKWGATLGLYYLFTLTAAVIYFVYWLVQKAIKTHSLVPILIAFLIGQAFIFSRGWLKVGLQAAQMDYFLSIKPAANIMESAPSPMEEDQTT